MYPIDNFYDFSKEVKGKPGLVKFRVLIFILM